MPNIFTCLNFHLWTEINKWSIQMDFISRSEFSRKVSLIKTITVQKSLIHIILFSYKQFLYILFLIRI